jgi:TFIIF-interacting CTD phosphatase-like protein
VSGLHVAMLHETSSPNLRRPGWKSFLQHVATKYEMHVYTMGTRAYAEQVCAAIDSDRKLFGGRILTRDESGSEYLWGDLRYMH